jgi:patatin-like phospholipase/acyl hydrolase
MSDLPIEPRSKGTLKQRRVQQPWPKEREFRILEIDGGGIKGIFPAMLLAEIEERYLSGGSVAEHFDLITGTSTGGIIALGLSIGMPARKIAELYTEHGGEIFPAPRSGWLGRKWQWFRDLARYRYDRAVLAELLSNTFGDRKFGDAKSRLCIPSCDGRFGDVYVFKTPHHPDFKKDRHELMTTVAMATAAAPTYFQPLDSGGYRFVDGGLWANNPIMVGVVDALSCFDLDRQQVRVLSLGCGDEPYTVSDRMVKWGGLLSWKKVINGAIAFQSQNALGQAGLLLGAERVLRIVPAEVEPPIELDDWCRAKETLPGAALSSFQVHGESIRELFLIRRY